MVVELSNKQRSPHTASVIEADVVNYMTKFFIGRALSVDGNYIRFKFLYPALGGMFKWPGRDIISK